MSTSPEVVNVTPPEVTKGIQVISWFSALQLCAVLSGCLDITLTLSPAVPSLAPLSIKEPTE